MPTMSETAPRAAAAPDGQRRQIDAVLADVAPVLRRHGHDRLAAEVEAWNRRSARAQRISGLLLGVGAVLAACAGIGVWGIRSGHWEWTVAVAVLSSFGALAAWALCQALEEGPHAD